LKLLFTQDALVNAGAERSHLDILSRFSKEVDVGFVYFYPKHDLKEAYERAGIRLFFLDIPESYHFPLAIYRLVRLIRTEKPDLLVSSLWRADITTRIASLITGVPLIGTLVNDSYSPLAWTDKKGLKYKLVYWLDRLTSGIPIHWIANAQALVDSHVKTLGIDSKKVKVVYRGREVPLRSSPRSVPARPSGGSPQTEKNIEKGVSCEDTGHGVEDTGHGDQIPPWSVPRSVPARPPGGSSQTEISIPPRSVSSQTGMHSQQTEINNDKKLTETSPFHFISYGRLLERKGFQDAIQAFSEVLKNYPDCSLTIFGEGPYRNELEKLILGLGLQECVFLPGKIHNPVDVLISDWSRHPTSDIRHPTSFHCFLFPSWYEGFSGALVEAMMAGIPIIASDIPMNLEAIEADKSALIFPVGNSKALKEKMIYAIEHPDLMLELGNQARSVASQRFDIDVIAKEYEGVFKGVLP
jgi:glycosyltransferase involved in cell wall biosynthesis